MFPFTLKLYLVGYMRNFIPCDDITIVSSSYIVLLVTDTETDKNMRMNPVPYH